MKKFIKIFLISFSSLLLLAILIVCVALWLVFTPERLTPIVRKQVPNFITCESEIGRVELTFFSTFPDFRLKAERVALINSKMNAPCDTLLNVKLLDAAVDIKALWKKRELILKDLRLSNGEICLFTDVSGKTNYDILPVSEEVTPVDNVDGFTLSFIDVNDVKLENIHLRYIDDIAKMKADVAQLSAGINGSMKGNDIEAKITTNPFHLVFEQDSTLYADISRITAQVNGNIAEDAVKADVKLSPFKITFAYEGEQYLNDAEIGADINAEVTLSRQLVQLNRCNLSVNGLALAVNGSVENDTIHKNIATDLIYEFEEWPITTLTALVPTAFLSYLDGMDVSGKLSSHGKITGVYNDSVMPLLDVNVKINDGNFKYADFYLPLSGIAGDIDIYTDLKNDALSYVHINSFKAQTPRSSISTSGDVKHLFSDIYLDLISDANLNISEFMPLVPKDMKVDAKGNVQGRINSALSLAQIEKMAIEKMKLSGVLTLTNIDATYDSLSVKTNRTKINFKLPNQKGSNEQRKFAYAAELTSDKLEATMIDGFNALLQNTDLTLETSDVRDTTKFPSVLLSFKADNMAATLDSINAVIENPAGSIVVEQQMRRTERQKFGLTYKSGLTKANMGTESYSVEKVGLKTDISYNEKEEDIFLKWLARGFIDVENAQAKLTGIPYAIEMPSLKMEFNPRKFIIEKTDIKLGEADFHLSGVLNNILPHFRHDSLLQGDFQFLSNNTDILQLMSLTNGLGAKMEGQTEAPISEDTTPSGPYMVPAGVDILLHTNIKQATLGADTISDIKGDIRVRDGILVLDELTLSTPATDMQVTAMYRTPRKNHLYLGLDLHMLDIEIAHLLNMIPEIDSIMPMLRSFGGKGEFHFAAECYLDSLYNIKMSTIRGASSIRGENLVLMDGETFSEIAKMLRFKKQTENKVDSLSAEFTIFRNEIDIYPFLIVMDKYKAVVAGKHNLDMSFDYNISLVQSPIPFRVTAEVYGTIDKLKFKLAKAKYPDFYRPASRKVVESKQVELRKLIRDALLGNMAKNE